MTIGGNQVVDLCLTLEDSDTHRIAAIGNCRGGGVDEVWLETKGGIRVHIDGWLLIRMLAVLVKEASPAFVTKLRSALRKE